MLKKAVSFLFFCFLSLILVNGLPVLSADKEIGQTRLPKILADVAAYCRMFSSASLNYVCLEEVTEVVHLPYRKLPPEPWDPLYTTQRNNYLYDYQLIQKDYDVKEHRILLEENGIKTNAQEAPLKVKRLVQTYYLGSPVDGRILAEVP